MYAIAKDSRGEFVIEFDEKVLVKKIEKAPKGVSNLDFSLDSDDRALKDCTIKIHVEKGDLTLAELLGACKNGAPFTAELPDYSELRDIAEWKTEEDFDNKYTTDSSVESEEFEDNGRLETYGEDLDLVKEILAKTPRRVWTMIEGDLGTSFIAGFHHCNRVAYLITVEEWENEDEAYFLYHSPLYVED